MSKRLSAEERRGSILHAAVPLFARQGFKGTTTRQIAQAAKVSEALLYRHFPSKEVLYRELQGYCTSHKGEAQETMLALEPSTQTLVDMVCYMMHMIVEGHHHVHPEQFAHTDINRMMIMSFLEDGDFARVFLDGKAEAWAKVFEACLQRAGESGDVVPTKIHPHAGLWMVHHLSVAIALLHLPEEAVVKYSFPEEALMEQAVRFCLRGVGLTDEAIERCYDPARAASFYGQPEPPAAT